MIILEFYLSVVGDSNQKALEFLKLIYKWKTTKFFLKK